MSAVGYTRTLGGHHPGVRLQRETGSPNRDVGFSKNSNCLAPGSSRLMSARLISPLTKSALGVRGLI